jgi:ABC-type polysaccharide/polyol phosphate export permease
MFPLDVYLHGDNVPDTLRTVVSLNPLIVLIELYRWVFLGTVVELDLLLRAGIVSVVVLAAGFLYFRGAEHRYGRA